jgi:ABC-type nickel/cobalt efflux system permease component RcnA
MADRKIHVGDHGHGTDEARLDVNIRVSDRGQGTDQVSSILTELEAHDAGHGSDRVTRIERLRESWQRRPLLLVVVGILTVASAMVGMILAGVMGVIAGVVLGVIGFAIGSKALVQVLERDVEVRK